ncbi:glycosyltransferase [Candidatus Omnitrophota bacterium]
MNEPFVSVIVPTYNSERTIKKCIDSLLDIDYSNYEIIIVDDGSSDKTRKILSEHKGVIGVIESQHSGPSRCRNIAVKDAKGDFIAFTDSDCIVDRNWIKELIKGFTQERVVGVGGIQISPNDETSFGKRVQEFFELTGFLGGYIKSGRNEELVEVSHNPSCNAVYRKSAFLEIGGFDEKLWPSEDVDLDYRLKKKGYIFMFNPKAVVYHYRPQFLKALLKMMSRYGYVQGILTKRYGFFRKIQIAPIFLIILLILIFNNPFWLIVPLIFYLYSLLKIKYLVRASYVFILSILSVTYWTAGFLGGLVALKK